MILVYIKYQVPNIRELFSKGHSSSTIRDDFTVIIHRTSTTHSLINTIRDITHSCDDAAADANNFTQIRVADRIWRQDISTGYGGRRNVGTTHGFPWVAVITFRSSSLQKNSGSYQKLRQHYTFMRVRDEEAWVLGEGCNRLLSFEPIVLSPHDFVDVWPVLN